MNETYQAARKAISALYAGAAPNGAQPDQLGDWLGFYADLCHVWESGGTPAVRRAFDVAARTNKRYWALLASDDIPAPPPLADVLTPELPAHLRPDMAIAAQASPWLNDYVAYSQRWSPRSFEDFHEAIGIWLLSTVAARRIVVHLGKPHYTPLCIALAGRSSIHAKTTAAEIGIDLLRAAGLDWLLADDAATPQKFIRDRTQRLPDGYDAISPDERERARLRLAFAGQCGWWYDEFGMLLHAIARSGSAMSDFSGLLRRFDDCAPSYTYGTIGRPTDKIIYPYLALLASLTPADLRPLMRKGGADWTNGFWPRWAFVTPPTDEHRTDRFPSGERHAPMHLVSQLRNWHDRLGTPTVAIQEKDVIVGPLPMHSCTVAPTVAELFYQYGDALMDLAIGSGRDDLDSWHSRLPTKALRIAALLASLENDNQIELTHWHRAVATAERWRTSLHRLYQQVNVQDTSEETTKEDTVLEVIQRLGQPSIRDLKTRIAWMSNNEIKDCADRLVRAGVIEAIQGRTIRYHIPSGTEGIEEAVSSVVSGIRTREMGEVKKNIN